MRILVTNDILQTLDGLLGSHRELLHLLRQHVLGVRLQLLRVVHVDVAASTSYPVTIDETLNLNLLLLVLALQALNRGPHCHHIQLGGGWLRITMFGEYLGHLCGVLLILLLHLGELTSQSLILDAQLREYGLTLVVELASPILFTLAQHQISIGLVELHLLDGVGVLAIEALVVFFLLASHSQITVGLQALNLALAVLLTHLDDLLAQLIGVAGLETLLQLIQFVLVDVKVVRLELQFVELFPELSILLLHLELHVGYFTDAVGLLLDALESDAGEQFGACIGDLLLVGEDGFAEELCLLSEFCLFVEHECLVGGLLQLQPPHVIEELLVALVGLALIPA